jgi:cob(I)alamin adenosyltransferase
MTSTPPNPSSGPAHAQEAVNAPPTERPPRPAGRAPSVVLVATGDGKGKTTAAMGTALRALARGWPVCVVQFIKSGEWGSGEVGRLQEMGAECHALGDGFTWDSQDLERSAQLARQAWATAAEAIGSGRYRLVVLDEVTYPINWGWVAAADVVARIMSRPARVNVFVTGRDAPAALVEVADTVTEMRNVKHAFQKGIVATKGIDY